VLKRRPIRIKLLVALALLSAIVLLLAFSGIWGLYQYRPVSEAIGQRTKQFESANGLRQHAALLNDAYKRLQKRTEPPGMIEESLLVDSISVKKSEFDLEMIGFDFALRQHEEVLKDARPSQLASVERQKRKIGEIAALFHRIGMHSQRMGPINNTTRLEQQLKSLLGQCDAHVATIETSMEEISAYVDQQYRTWIAMVWTCTILSFAMVAVLLWSFHSLVVQPFRTLLDGSRLVAGGQFDHRIDLGTGDELSELASAMNHMTDRFQGALAQVKSWASDLDRQVQQRTREVIQNEQLASVGFLAAGVAHEINNPLASIAWSAESLQSRMSEIASLPSDDRVVNDEFCEALTTNLRRIEEEAYRCKGITEKLLDFSRLNEVQRAPTDLSELVREVVAMVGKVGKFRCKKILIHADKPVITHVNPQEIRQVVLNLVTNALESVTCDGHVDIDCRTRDGFASITVKDDGCGMSREVLQHLFEPFFTRRRDGTGTGLGLSITYRIVSQHGGSLLASSNGEGQGSELEMVLPLVMDDPNNESPSIPLLSSREV